METLGQDFIGSITSAGRLLILMVPVYFAILGLYFYVKHRMANPYKNLGKLKEDELKDVTGDWFGDKESPEITETTATNITDNWQIAENIMLADEDGAFHSIDFLINTGNSFIILQYVTEIGDIFGAEDDDMWQQNIGNKSFNFPNPLRRIKSSIEAVKSLISDDNQIYGYVIFPDAANIPENNQLLTANQIPHSLLEKDDDVEANKETLEADWEKVKSHSTITNIHDNIDILQENRGNNNTNPSFISVLMRPTNLILIAILLLLIILVF